MFILWYDCNAVILSQGSKPIGHLSKVQRGENSKQALKSAKANKNQDFFILFTPSTNVRVRKLEKFEHTR